MTVYLKTVPVVCGFLFLTCLLACTAGENTHPPNHLQSCSKEIIRDTYLSILHREPDPEGLAHFLIKIEKEGRDRQWLEESLKNSPEYRTLSDRKRKYNTNRKRSLLRGGVLVFMLLLVYVVDRRFFSRRAGLSRTTIISAWDYVIGYLVLLLFVVFLTMQWWNWNMDDACIVFRVVRNVTTGQGWAFNPGEAHNASTSVLNTLIISGFALTGLPTHVCGHIAGGLYLFFAGAVIFSYLCREYKTTLIALLGSGFIIWTMVKAGTWGLETNLFISLILAIAVSRASGLRWFLLGFAVLARPDAVLFGPILVCADFYADRRLNYKGIMLAGLVLLPWTLFSLMEFHSIFPDTLSRKIWQGQSGFWGCGHIYWRGLAQKYSIGLSAGHWLQVVLAAMGIVLSTRQCRALIGLAVFTLGQQLVYVLLNVPFYHWYSILLDVVMALYIVICISECAARLNLPDRFAVFRVFRNAASRFRALRYFTEFVLLLAVLYWGISNRKICHLDGRDQAYRAIIHEIDRRNGPGDLAVVEVGTIGYNTSRRILDIIGLTSAAGHFTSSKRMDKFYETPPEYVLLNDPVWMFERAIREDARFDTRYELCGCYDNPERKMKLYKQRALP